MDQALSAAREQDKREQIETDTQEVPPEHEQELIYCVGDQTQEQIAQRGWGVSPKGDIQEPSGHNPVPRALGWPYLAKGLDEMTHLSSNLTYSEILWYEN